ncbi:MAG: shikimate kinase [Pseudomonadota bacterium]
MTDSTIIKKSNSPKGFRIMKNIVLVGLMGAGKSTVGRKLAEHIGVRFIDSDNEIVEAAKCSISDIFEIYGETAFRDLEKRVILRLLSEEPMIIATGGGAFINPEIREEIEKYGFSIWLSADIETLLDRVSRRNTRPLLETGNKREILSKLMNERNHLYALADAEIDNSHENQAKLIANIIISLKENNVLKEI